MLLTENIFTDGFLAGMRACGFLLEDVEDEDLQLTADWRLAIQRAYIKKDYPEEKKRVAQDLRRIFTSFAEEDVAQRARIAELETLLREANKDKEMLLSKEYEV